MATGERRLYLRLHSPSSILDRGDTKVTCYGDGIRLCTYNERTVSTDADLRALLGAAECIKFHAVVLQETTRRSSDVQQMNDGTLDIRVGKVSLRNVGDVGLPVHPFPVHFVVSQDIS
ncbi:hypothetical protein RB195_004231 [Necator americanus]|uniref:FHA domain-containing protein n=1 Tax=Necator americanus TaxID=51031 RepID=A0ABR1BIR4_NECAM